MIKKSQLTKQFKNEFQITISHISHGTDICGM